MNQLKNILDFNQTSDQDVFHIFAQLNRATRLLVSDCFGWADGQRDRWTDGQMGRWTSRQMDK